MFFSATRTDSDRLSEQLANKGKDSAQNQEKHFALYLDFGNNTRVGRSQVTDAALEPTAKPDSKLQLISQLLSAFCRDGGHRLPND